MVEQLITGVWLGLVSGSLCVGCWVVLVPMMVSEGPGRLRRSGRVFLQFTLGRLISYSAFGAVVGFAGSRLADASWVSTAAYAAFIPLSLILLAQAIRGGGSKLCRSVEGFAARSRLPFWVGAAMGLSVCPPFLIQTARALQAGSTAAGLVSFFGFFVGATVFMLPFVLFGLAGRTRFARDLGRAACILAALFFLHQGLGGLVGTPGAASVEVTEADLRELLPEADRFGEWVAPTSGPRYREAFDAAGNQLALIYLSSDICPRIRGFGGHVPLLAAVRPGELVAVKLLEGWETPSYVTRIYDERYVEDFRNRPADATLVPGEDIDAVTGATVTNRAICEEVAAIITTTIGREKGGAGRGVSMSAIMLAALFVAATVSYLLRLRWLRFGIMAASVIYLGFYMKGLLYSTADTARVLYHGEGLLKMGAVWMVLVGGIVLTSVLFGRLLCGYICPFGALHEFCGRLAGARRKISGRLAGRLKYIKYAILFTAPALVLVSGRVSDAAVEPFGVLFSLGGSALQWVFLAFVLSAGFLVMRFFCRFLCPAGALMAILSMPRLVRDRRRTGCGACGKCIEKCPVGALAQSGSILDADYTECLDCNDCAKEQSNAPCA